MKAAQGQRSGEGEKGEQWTEAVVIALVSISSASLKYHCWVFFVSGNPLGRCPGP